MRPTILIGLDGSERSLKAAEHAARIAHDARLVLLHVGLIPPELLEHGGAEDPALEKRLEQQVGERSRQYEQQLAARTQDAIFGPAIDRIRRCSGEASRLDIETKLATEPHPDPARAIIAEARAHAYDAVVIGRHGRSAVSEFLFGGVAFKVLHHLRTAPVWVVP